MHCNRGSGRKLWILVRPGQPHIYISYVMRVTQQPDED
jgi:hypothetical protein